MGPTRMRKRATRAALSAMAALMSTGVVAQAQAPAPSVQPPVVREQIEVVATRVPESPHDVPVSIEVIDGNQLRATGATTLRDALSLAAGIEVAPGGDTGPAGAVPEFWGLRELDAFLLVVDDIPWGGAFNPALPALSLHDVERIEVLRGAAPVTYGATSFVGVIHVVHRTASADRSYLSLGVGTFRSGTAALEVALRPLGAWASRLTVDGERQGFADDRTSFVRGHANYRVAKADINARTWLFADLSWLNQAPASPHVREGATLSTATPLDANYNPANAFVDETRLAIAGGRDRPLSARTRWSATASYAHSAQQMFRGFLTGISNTPGNATGFRENIDVNDIYGDMHVAWSANSRLQVVTGGDLLFGNGEGRGATFAYTAPLAAAAARIVAEPELLDLDSESRREFAGAYVSAEWLPTPRVHVSSGVRMNATQERRGEGESTTHARPAGMVGATVSIWQRGANHVNVFGSYRDTFKPAAFDFSLAENEGVLEPETARSIEGGVKIRAAERRLELEASAFRMDFKNLVTATVIDGLPSLQNSGSTRFQGFEVAWTARPSAAVTGRISYSFHDATFVDFVQAFGNANTQLAGNRFEMSARRLVSAGLIAAPGSGMAGHIIVKYVGDRYLNKRNTALAPGFVTVDAGAAYRFERYELRLDGRNLSDRRDPTSESELGEAQYYRMTARQLNMTLGVRF